jgi:hypothetical protein
VSRPLPELPDLLRPPEDRRSKWVRVVYLLGAVLCLLLGVVGWLVPIVTGLPFMVAGIILLSMGSPAVLRWINRIERKLPLQWRHALRAALARIPSEKLRRRIRQSGERD